MGCCIGKKSEHIDDCPPYTLNVVLQDVADELDSSSDELDSSSDDNIHYSFHIYLHKEQTRQRDCELISWCTSKLELTEDIIRINRSTLQRNLSSENQSAIDDVHREVEQLEAYRKKLIEVMEHLRRLNYKQPLLGNIKKKRSHKCAAQIIAALMKCM